MDILKPSSVAIGVDLGARIDPSAICVVEHVGELFKVRHIERLPLGTSYRGVAARVGELYRKTAARLYTQQARADFAAGGFLRAPYMDPPPTVTQHTLARERIVILADATGGGIPATEIMREHPDLDGARLIGVFITSGERCSVTPHVREGSVGKAHLVGRLQSLLQPPARIEWPAGSEVEALREELRDYEIRVNDADAKLTAGVFKTGKHDDLATALGLACLLEQTTYRSGSTRYA